MSDEPENSTNAGSESSHTRAIADDSLRILIGCADTLPSAGTCADEEEWLHLQSQSLVSWASREKWLIDADRFRLLTSSLKELGGGQEHTVFFYQTTGRVLKITKPPYFGCPLELGKYALNSLWSNLLWEDSITFEGVLHTAEGISVVVSQPYVHGTSPSDLQIQQWFEEQGYVKKGFNRWHGPNGEIVADAHTGNFIRRRDGFLIPIDLQILNPGPAVLALTK